MPRIFIDEILRGVYPERDSSVVLRSFASLRMTKSEGLRMTQSEGLRMTQGEGLAMTEGGVITRSASDVVISVVDG